MRVNQAGQIVWKDNQAQRPVASINMWTSSFLIFAAVYLPAHPHRAQELLKYCSIVGTASARHSGWGWRSFDIHFWKRQAARPHNRSWAIIDGQLWTMFVQASPRFLMWVLP